MILNNVKSERVCFVLLYGQTSAKFRNSSFSAIFFLKLGHSCDLSI